jgi:hypothetical protein
MPRWPRRLLSLKEKDRLGELAFETVAAREVEVDLEGEDVPRRELFEGRAFAP